MSKINVIAGWFVKLKSVVRFNHSNFWIRVFKITQIRSTMAEELTLEVDNNEFQNDLEMGSGDQTSKTKETKSEEMNKDLEVGELPDSPQDRTVKRKGRGFEKSNNSM